MIAGDKDLTPRERKAVSLLKQAARHWPDSLWLYCGSGSMAVLRVGEDGRPAMTSDGAVDQDYVVEPIGIPSDGGDW